MKSCSKLILKNGPKKGQFCESCCIVSIDLSGADRDMFGNYAAALNNDLFLVRVIGISCPRANLVMFFFNDFCFMHILQMILSLSWTI